MSNWLFLMLLYVFFGWMKKRQQTKAREKIESQEGWDTGKFVEFGEEIIENILGEDSEKEEVIKEEVEDDLIFETSEAETEFSKKKTEEYSEPILDTKNVGEIKHAVHAEYEKINLKNISYLNRIIDLKSPIKTAIILKEVLDKPRALRRRIR